MKHSKQATTKDKLSGAVGAALIKLLSLKHNQHGRIDTSIGDKTAYGLAKTVERILNDDKFAKSIANS